MSGRLEGKRAIVTGGASGIGRAIADAYLREGAHVAVFDRSEAALAALAADFSEAAYSGFVCDVTNADAVDAAVGAARERQGPADILVNNAGISISGGLEEIAEVDWDLTFAVNVKSIYLVSRRVIPQMQKQGGGSIINMASESAYIGFAMHPAYCASKAAVLHLSRSMAARYAPDRIRTNALCPGTIDTPLYRNFLAQQESPDVVRRAVEAMHPLGIGTPEDIAHAAVFLGSDESRYATGAPFLIDGGATAI